MNLISNYPDFKHDIILVFSALINEYDLVLRELAEGRFLLEGANCNLRFTYDRGDVFCGFKLPEEVDQDTVSYGVWPVYRYLHPSSDTIDNISYDPRVQLEEYAVLIKEKLKNILTGDFSWLPGFLTKEAHDQKISRFVLNEFDFNHPISKKFWDGDVSWKNDIEKYLMDNHIKL